jgi:hypothetical protein
MARLIDAYAFKWKLIRELNKSGKYTPYECGLDDALSYLDKQPTVDAVPVVHGRWKHYHKQNMAVCTNCSFERDLDTNFGNAVSCPNCGAKMDLEE